jgi:hypothetical protein
LGDLTRRVPLLSFTYVTMLPYVFLVNHRFEVYSYMPFVGIAGLLALGINALKSVVVRTLPRRFAWTVLSLVFVVVAVRNFRHEEHRSRLGRAT